MTNILRRALSAAGSDLRTSWLMVGLLLLILGAELGLVLVLIARDRPPTEPETIVRKIDRWTRDDAYQGATWTHDYFAELQLVQPFVWQSYVYWRRPPYQGRYINADRNGLRATWSPPPQNHGDHPPPVRIATFGGSTMWGWGYATTTRSPPTWASCCTSGVMLPDIALFYDGINEIFAAAINGAASIPQNGWRRRRQFDLLHRPRRLLVYSGR